MGVLPGLAGGSCAALGGSELDPGWILGGTGAEPGWLAGGSCMGLLVSTTWFMPCKNHDDENRKTGGSDLPRAL